MSSDIRDMIVDLFRRVHNSNLCPSDGSNECKVHDEIAHILGYEDEFDMNANCKDEDVVKLKPFFGEHFRTLWKAARAKYAK